VGIEAAGRRPLYRFDFAISLLNSHSTMTVQGKSATTAQAGSFWVDKDSLDIARVETHAVDIPPDIDCKEDFTSATYSQVNLGNGERLLPVLSELTLVNRDGRTNHNTVTFSGCRRYTATSSISFEEQPDVSAATAKAKETGLPEGLTLRLKLNEPITIEESAAGDQIVARLDNAVKSGDVHLAKGTKVLGRIRRLEQHSQPHKTFTIVGLEFYAAETSDGLVRFKARLTGPESTRVATASMTGGTTYSSGGEGLDIADDGRGTGVGRFRISGKAPRLQRGFLTVWETQ
jgi:hypothetical protein